MADTLIFVGHYVNNQVIGLAHAIMTNASEVVDGAVDVIFDNTFRGFGKGVMHRHGCGEYSGSYAAGYLQCTGWFGTVANHAGDIGNHVLDGESHLIVLSTHEIG